jgi:transcriptional regulator with XRE-family HTH domain
MPENLPQNIATVLARLRKRHRLSYSKLEDLTGVSHSALHAYEHGEKNISVEKLSKILNYYDVSLSQFFKEIEKLKK